MAPKAARKADRMCLWLGSMVPVLLRKCPQRRYELVGDIYVHGIMKGVTMTEGNRRKMQDFEIQ